MALSVRPADRHRATLNATVDQPLTLTLWAKDKPHTYDPEEDLPRATSGTRESADDAAAAAGAAARGERSNQNFDVSAARRGTATGRGAFGRGGPQSDVTVTWKVHRGSSAGEVRRRCDPPEQRRRCRGVMEATTTRDVHAAGDYMLRAQVNDKSGDGGGGEQCCWTNALVKVTVK